MNDLESTEQFSFSVVTRGDRQEIKITIPSDAEDVSDRCCQGDEAYAELFYFTAGWTIGVCEPLGITGFQEVLEKAAKIIAQIVEDRKIRN
jgi:hypothetical protein